MRLVINTLPKSGTHLLREMVKGMGLRRGAGPDSPVEELVAMADGCFALGHRPYSPALADALSDAGIRILALVRDPRDFIVSLAHHRLRTEPGDFATMLASLCREDAAGGSTFDRYLAGQFGWQGDDRVLVVRFENLVGARGGGSDAAQLAVGRRIAAHLGMPLADAHIMAAMEHGAGTTGGQFRRGQIGAWRDEMTPEVSAFVNRERASVLRAWGYEPEG